MVALPVRPYAIALNHQQGRAFLGNSKENMRIIAMLQNEDAFDRCIELLNGMGRLVSAFVNIGPALLSRG